MSSGRSVGLYSTSELHVFQFYEHLITHILRNTYRVVYTCIHATCKYIDNTGWLIVFVAAIAIATAAVTPPLSPLLPPSLSSSRMHANVYGCSIEVNSVIDRLHIFNIHTGKTHPIIL